MRAKFNTGILYLCIHKRLDEMVGLNRLIAKKRFFLMLAELYHVPKKLRPLIFKEMSQLGMIEKENPDQIRFNYIRVLPLELDPIEEHNKLYQRLGFF